MAQQIDRPDTESPELVAQLRAYIGQSGTPQTARDAVNESMIRHWCDAMTDGNPVYTDSDYAGRSIHGEIVAPPAMLNAWGMPGLVPRPAPSETSTEPSSQVYALLDDAGFTSVVATNSEHEYHRYLRVGDLLTFTARVEDVSEEKHTALGAGHFVTSVTQYHNQDGELVGAMKFVILKFKPGTGRAPTQAGDGGASPATERPRRPRPGISLDTRFFWDGIRHGELRIQHCEKCDVLHHPPMVRCPDCGSYDLGYEVASGRATLYSYVEIHHPKVPAFDYPLVVGLVELEEGTRLLTNVVDIAPEKLEVGMPLELVCRPANSEMDLPLFRPRRPERRRETLRFSDVEVGQALAPWPISITPTLIVAGAIASRDYQDVHHDRDLSIQRGSPDIFMNILTTNGLCSAFVSDWAGPEARLVDLRIRLGAPNYPGDTMTMEGVVRSAQGDGAGGTIEVGLRGYNRLGNHVTGTATLALPGSGATG